VIGETSFGEIAHLKITINDSKGKGISYTMRTGHKRRMGSVELALRILSTNGMKDSSLNETHKRQLITKKCKIF